MTTSWRPKAPDSTIVLPTCGYGQVGVSTYPPHVLSILILFTSCSSYTWQSTKMTRHLTGTWLWLGGLLASRYLRLDSFQIEEVRSGAVGLSGRLRKAGAFFRPDSPTSNQRASRGSRSRWSPALAEG